MFKQAGTGRTAGIGFYFDTSVLAFGLAALSTSLGQVILPFRLLDLAQGSLKNNYLGILTFAGMAVAMAVQPAIGYLSDQGMPPWGRRLPYIVAGVGIFMTAGRAMITDMVSRVRAAYQLGIANLVLLAGLAASKGGGAIIDGLNRWREELEYNALLAMCGVCFLVEGLIVSTLKAEPTAHGTYEKVVKG